MTSTGSGLAVPDWPLSYGTLFPPMVGGIFYEHGHRMVASTVGFFTLILAIWVARKERRGWVKKLGFFALGAVILQGLLGGITVLFFLPTAISVLHGVLAQTFFLTTIFLAYALSIERLNRETSVGFESDAKVVRFSFKLVILIYFQLILAAVMRHTHSGLAIPDFPTMGGYWLPPFNQTMLDRINQTRFMGNLDPVQMWQVILHFMHRFLALLIVVGTIILNRIIFARFPYEKLINRSVLLIDGLVLVQISLGILTVLTWKSPYITSLHVVTGAATLGVSFLILLRVSPLSFRQFQQITKA